ncbi:MAG: helix-turn-helix transcriptional regulator [Clostridia bacterium]|nr:helix-turn-helix transcriptional regulator [Clostridia bacterium]
MFINKTPGGQNNICGVNVARLRKQKKWSQNRLASMLQIHGLNVDKNAIQRIEAGKRFVTDIELAYLSRVLEASLEDLLDGGALFGNTSASHL